ncbi:hypothetical protein [Rhizobium sp. CF142]|uniref:hypothetical protein n=1 Tax=Rhizobium sp. CF142 TaxID=1144314 RepID=UPI00026EFFB3|nr:hypothetical protein [Rhizobium sp. CF142]EJJ26252.1 hypothetical protein PMI11_05504 [Rhizobium sp. CF142]
MTTEPPSSNVANRASDVNPFACLLWFLARLPFVILRGIVGALFYSIWYLAFYVLCMFRSFTGMMVPAAIVLVPLSIVVFAHPEAARGSPFWAFGLMGLGFVALALGYTLFVDWITPSGAEDPFERYRRSDR